MQQIQRTTVFIHSIQLNAVAYEAGEGGRTPGLKI